MDWFLHSLQWETPRSIREISGSSGIEFSDPSLGDVRLADARPLKNPPSSENRIRQWHQTKTGRHYWYLLTQTKFLIGIIAIHTPAEDFSNPGFSGLPPGFIGANSTNWWPNAVAQPFYRDRITAHVAEVKRHIPISTGRLNLSLAAYPIREM